MGCKDKYSYFPPPPHLAASHPANTNTTNTVPLYWKIDQQDEWHLKSQMMKNGPDTRCLLLLTITSKKGRSSYPKIFLNQWHNEWDVLKMMPHSGESDISGSSFLSFFSSRCKPGDATENATMQKFMHYAMHDMHNDFYSVQHRTCTMAHIHTVEILLRRIVCIHYSAVHALHYCTTYRVLEWILTGRTWVWWEWN